MHTKSFLPIIFSLTLLLLSSFSCGEEPLPSSQTVLNSSSDTIAVIIHFDSSDTTAIVSKTKERDHRYVGLVYPGSSLTLKWDWFNRYHQLSIFRYSDYVNCGGFENLHECSPLIRYELYGGGYIFYPADVYPNVFIDDAEVRESWVAWLRFGYDRHPKGWDGLPESEWPDWYKYYVEGEE